jgi:hypothetical protein
MSHVEDTQIKNGTYKPGTLLDDGKWRVEFDSMGQVKVPAERLWGAQTQRSLIHFSIGNEKCWSANSARTPWLFESRWAPVTLRSRSS